jgi:pimeloyl-ACP methyl ester carboxylesterase
MPETLSSPPGKSTNVRFKAGASARRAGLSLLGRVLPGAAAAAAERLFFTPPPASRAGVVLPPGARPLDVRVDGRRVAAWRWGKGPVVVLVHGWGGRAAQFAPLVAPLTARGFTAVAFDAPGHGTTSAGRSSMPEFARTLRAVADVVGAPHAVVGHSLGAAAAAFAVNAGLRPARLVLVAPAADPAVWTRVFAARLGLGDEVMRRMRARSEERLGFRWSDLPLPLLLRSYTGELFVVHDRDDREVPWTEGRAVAEAVPGARMLLTGGLGHRRVLRDPEVVSRTAAFVAAPLAEGAPGAGAADAGCEACGRAVAPPHAVCATCTLERALFDPRLRGGWARTA